jgi:hypothetical protein
MFLPGATVTVLATPNAGYTFVSWTENGSVVSTSASYTFTATVNRALVANFSAATSYTITTSSSPTAGGTTSGGGTKTSGSTVTVTATANSGYNFVNWTENGIVMSTSASYNFTATGNRNLVANFTVSTTTPGQCLWEWDLGGTNPLMVDSAYGCSVATDSSGNVFVAGYFWGTVKIAGVTLTSTSSSDLFVGKLSPSGSVLWVKRFGLSGNSNRPTSVAVDSNGNVILTGYFNGTIDFGLGTLTTKGASDIFVAKFSSSGTCQWSKSYGSLADDKALSAAVDGSGDVFIAGYYGLFGNGIDLGNGVVALNAGARALFLVKYSGVDGHYLWAKTISTSGGEEAHGVAVDTSGNAYITGSFGGTVDFGGGLVSASGSMDGFVAKYSGTNGSFISVRPFGGSGSTVYGTGIGVDSSGNAVVIGYFKGTANFGAGVINADPSADGFVLKYSPSYSVLWYKQFGYSDTATRAPSFNAVSVDGGGNVAITGTMNSPLTFGGGWLINSSGEGTPDVLVVKYKPDGSYVWAKRTGTGLAWDNGMGVAIDKNGNTFVTGDFGYADVSGAAFVDFGCGPIYSPDNVDGFLTKIAP